MTESNGKERATSALVLVRDRGTAGAVAYPLRSPDTTIGSGAAADIRLLSAHVSSIHCTIKLRGDGTVAVVDDDSVAGTRVGGDDVTDETPLPLGGELTVGDVRLTLEEREATSQGGGEGGGVVETIAGSSALRGVLLYGAILVFAGLFAYFIYEIANAPAGHPPKPEGALVAVAAALAGVLGSGFALAIGVPVAKTQVNEGLARHLEKAAEGKASTAAARVRQAVSLQPADQSSTSWPMTVGVWMYGLVGAATFITYLTSASETPEPVKALAIAFAGYMVALLTVAYSAGKSTT
jgi:pSer/pThr/pTyr-binding forkhead associated (FHA) protein